MKSIIQTIVVTVILCFGSASLFAQLSDLHYLPPLKQRSNAFEQQLIYLSTPETSPFEVKVYQGTNPEAVATFNISNSSGATYNPGNQDNNVTLLTDAKTGTVQSNSGLRFEAPSGKKFYVNWRGKSASQGSSLTSKGRVALGTAFKWVGAPNRGTFLEALSNSMGIMATEDNTVVTIFGYNPNCTFRLGANAGGITSDEIVVNLNKGETFVLEAVIDGNETNRDGWIGASVTSNKPIAMNVGQMHYQPNAAASSRDAGIDQIIPENTLGKEYIFVRGRGIDVMEFPVIIATQNDTKIYVNGSNTPIATINAGDYYCIPSTYYSESSTSVSKPGANMYVRTSKEAYAVQSLAGDVNDATGDLNFIAPVNCLLASSVDNIPSITNIAGVTISGGITIIASSAIADEDITVQYGNSTVPLDTLIAAKKTVAGTSEWKTYYLAGLSGNVKVSANGPIAVGYVGYSGVIGASGYFSGFETIPTIEVEKIGDGCLPSTILKATPGFTAYTWYRDGVVVPGVNSNTYAPEVAGKFTVTVTNGSCSYTSANQYIYDCNPELIITTTADKNGILSGETVQFQVTVRYLGDFNATNLVLTSVVPVNVMVTGTSATYGSVSNVGGTYTWNIGTMRNGEEHILTLTAMGGITDHPWVGTLNVSKSVTLVGSESNKIPDDFSETITVYPALAGEPADHPSGWYFTNTGSAHPYNNVLYFTGSASADGYLIVRNIGTEPTFIPVDGTSYQVGPVTGGEIIYIGSDTSITDLNATANSYYHYTIYPYKGGGAATNYLTTNPLKALINNRSSNSYDMSEISKSSSAGFADQGVNVTFINGVATGGTTLSVTKYSNATPVNYQQGLPVGASGVKKLYFSVTSSAASPGNYVISLDFSELGLSELEWDEVRLLKRSNSGSNWEEITDKIIDRRKDGLSGKLLVGTLSSFSEFALLETNSTLPLTWVDFTAKRSGNEVVLNWKTAQEVNTRNFTIQHSRNGISWEDLGTVSAAGTSIGIHSYQFVHQSPETGVNYYRVLQRDIDGQFSFSDVKTVNFEGSKTTLTILGNPVVNGTLKFRLEGKANVMLKTLQGRTVYNMPLQGGLHEIGIQHLASGTYLLIADKDVMKVMINN
ncbi:MAG TPA: hypothetical protein VIK74_04300 [Parasegetibacter sp.]